MPLLVAAMLLVQSRHKAGVGWGDLRGRGMLPSVAVWERCSLCMAQGGRDILGVHVGLLQVVFVSLLCPLAGSH